MKNPTIYRTMAVDGVSIFYREAGPKDGGHFALDTAADEIAELVRRFVASSRLELSARHAN